ncbi:apolipoprotein N-acyltransferase [Rubellicoccus peritrichatus]|uniref:Apolipoprotein N-acyltransferase n=1 Tax=Rubellicoccus peritrichatus TaxID=3080537 RepID=A0AAQ3LFG8_9BACT|nr:apolipoprotein N-acyltransferase [Puniceicoccus sp. CR14]WOO42778.1 apolipoprotein N-acyltransferase [Puniceicoccus sp. CR14]
MEIGATEKAEKRSSSFELAIGVLAAVISTLLYVSCFPPFDVAEAAYVFALPFLIWCFFKPRWKIYLLCAFLASWVSWFMILIWLRHIHPPWGWLATALLALLMTIAPLAWLSFVRWGLPRVINGAAWQRIIMMFGLAGFWILLEWLRSWLFTGFPWLPLSASQWQTPAMLQLAAWTGHYGISFVLIFLNLGLVFYGRSLVRQVKRRVQPKEPKPETESARRRFDTMGQNAKPLFGGLKFAFCPEFYLSLGMLMFCFSLYIFGFKERSEREPMFRAAAVQPWIPATLKWDPDQARNNLDILERQTEIAALLDPDVILWPEAATPFPILDNRDDGMLRWTERLVNTIDTNLLCGNLAILDGDLFNGVFWVRPEKGIFDEFYLKRHPVPFGEYTPFRDYLPFLDKVVPLANDIIAAEDATVIPIELNGQSWPVGFLICNEDIYPSLAREMALEGASWILVVTNDAWYGTEGGAYQHAANSVLRAVETRLPVVRCGNHGWTGWIDEFGQIRYVLTNGEGSIYFQGAGPMNLTRSTSLVGKQSFYVKHGDWFVALCGVFFIAAIIVSRLRAQKI